MPVYAVKENAFKRRQRPVQCNLERNRGICLGTVHNFVFVFFLLSLILENSQSQNQTMKGKSGIRQCRSTIHLLAGLQAIALGTDAIRLGAETGI